MLTEILNYLPFAAIVASSVTGQTQLPQADQVRAAKADQDLSASIDNLANELSQLVTYSHKLDMHAKAHIAA